ncbi:Hypothetical predicted protein [Cloeon dipterum]|uniref:Chitin-binding type-2 domain-containing protein n=1 Tax=Cloeon dipterum TaxID=197152 RepID=A0A8S1C6Q2_9INSE|nr:Hypothetical predicted protein [Cloeon dipterum]
MIRIFAICVLATASLASRCPQKPDCSAGRLELHPHADCSKFYKCEDGLVTTFVCPEGMAFSRVHSTCDSVANVSCVFCSYEELKNTHDENVIRCGEFKIKLYCCLLLKI